MISAVILAAGYSSRMGKFKPLLPVGGIPALERLIRSVYDGGINHVAVVTGFMREKLQPVIVNADTADMHVIEAFNAGFDSGMFSSIKKGIAGCREAFPKSEGFLLIPVDCPLVDGDIIKKLKAGVTEAGAAEGLKQAESFAVPVYEGKKGHPLYVPACYADEICAYDGPGGLKAITDKYWDRMIRVPVNDEGCILDMDTRQGYEEIESFLEGGRRRESIETLAAGRRIVLVRHGETRRHSEKMFIGQYDVPLSDEGRRQIEETAAKLSVMNLDVNHIYCSDLQRAVVSAGIIAESLIGAAAADMICPIKDLREINLGAWDGKAVREIKENFPAEYERRGRDIFTFKTGNKAENFYDMQYRAVRALRRILTEDESRDIVIVTHSGVIRALQNNICGLRVNDPWESIPKGGFVVMTT